MRRSGFELPVEEVAPRRFLFSAGEAAQEQIECSRWPVLSHGRPHSNRPVADTHGQPDVGSIQHARPHAVGNPASSIPGIQWNLNAFVPDSIFQSKNEHERGLRRRVLGRKRMRRPRAADFLSSVFVFRERTTIVVASGYGKVGNLLLVFHFSMAVKPGCGNVGISRCLRDFQGAVERVGKLLLLFHAFHGPGISIGCRARYRNGGGSGDCTLHCRSSRDLAAFIRRAHSVSLIASASRSSSAKLTPGLRYCSA